MRLAQVAAASLVALVASGHATAQAPGGDYPRFAPPAASVVGSNGFKVWVFPTSPFNRRSDAVSLLAGRGAAWAVYSDHGVVSRNRIRARFGKHGFLDLRFKPTGLTKRLKQRGGCGTTFPTRLGSFRGVIRFSGERRFTTVNATQAKATAAPSRIAECMGGQGPVIGGGYVTGDRRFRDRSLTYTAIKSSTTAPTFVRALTNDQQRNPNVYRVVAKALPSEAFTYSRDAATLVPGPPFIGRAHYAVTRGVCTETTAGYGSLSVAFPGMKRVRLLSPAMEQRLVTLLPSPTPAPGAPPGPICTQAP